MTAIPPPPLEGPANLVGPSVRARIAETAESIHEVTVEIDRARPRVALLAISACVATLALAAGFALGRYRR